jgi:hypothetical protein
MQVGAILVFANFLVREGEYLVDVVKALGVNVPVWSVWSLMMRLVDSQGEICK